MWLLGLGKIVDTDTTAHDGLFNEAFGHARCKRGVRACALQTRRTADLWRPTSLQRQRRRVAGPKRLGGRVRPEAKTARVEGDDELRPRWSRTQGLRRLCLLPR